MIIRGVKAIYQAMKRAILTVYFKHQSFGQELQNSMCYICRKTIFVVTEALSSNIILLKKDRDDQNREKD